MIIGTFSRNVLLAGFLASLVACGSSELPPDTVTFDNGTPTQNAPPASDDDIISDDTTEAVADQPPENDTNQTPDDTPAQTPEEAPDQTPEETPDQTPEEAPAQTPEEAPDQTPEEAPAQTPEEAPDQTPEEAPDQTPLDTSDPVTAENPDTTPTDTTPTDPSTDNTGLDVNPEPQPLIPAVEQGSDLDRLIKGMTRQAALTLIDLNIRLSQGEELTEQQEQCLGTYEPGFGIPLYEVNCERELATNDIPVYVGDAAFYNTDECLAALASQNAVGCVLQSLSFSMHTQYEIPPGGRLPVPTFPGARLTYAVTGSSLTINNSAVPVTGVFSCVVDLDTNAVSDVIHAGSCPDIIKTMADRIELLQGF